MPNEETEGPGEGEAETPLPPSVRTAALGANITCVIVAVLTVATWATAFVPDVLRKARFGYPVLTDVVVFAVLAGMGIAVPVAGIYLARSPRDRRVGIGCVVAILSFAGSVLAMTLLAGLAGIAAS